MTGPNLALALAGSAVVGACAPWRARPRPRCPRATASSPPSRHRTGLALGQAVRWAHAGWVRWTAWTGGRLLGLVPRRIRRGAADEQPGPVDARGRSATTRADQVNRRDPDAVLASRLGTAVTVGALAALASPVLAVAGAGLMWARPAWQARSRRRGAERDLIEAAPDLVEGFRLAVGSGLSVHQSVRALAVRLQGPGADALAEVVAREDRGERLADGLEGLARRGEPLRPLASALTAAERYGAPLGPALDRAVAEAREVRRRRAEEAARRLPVVLLFPLVLCILPAAALLTVVPLLAASWPRLTG